MDKSMILELAFSGTNYAETVKITEIAEFKEDYDKFDEICDKLCEGISKDEKHKILWDLELAVFGMGSVYSKEYFKAGFKLGLTIAAQNFLD